LEGVKKTSLFRKGIEINSYFFSIFRVNQKISKIVVKKTNNAVNSKKQFAILSDECENLPMLVLNN